MISETKTKLLEDLTYADINELEIKDKNFVIKQNVTGGPKKGTIVQVIPLDTFLNEYYYSHELLNIVPKEEYFKFLRSMKLNDAFKGYDPKNLAYLGTIGSAESDYDTRASKFQTHMSYAVLPFLIKLE